MKPNFISEEQFKVFENRVRGTAQPRASASLAGVRGTFDSVASAHRGKSPSPYKSKLEAAYASQLDIEQKAGLIKSWRYEPMSLTLASGKRYRPDFMVHTIDAARISYIELIEVKGRTGKNRRDGMTHLRWAAQLYPMFTWRLMTWNGSGFVGEYIT